jgi:hypothetical protein
MRSRSSAATPACLGVMEANAGAASALPVAGVVHVNHVRCGEGDDPQADDHTADGEDPVTGTTVVVAHCVGFAGAEDLAADADGHEKSAECECEPSHGVHLCTPGFTDLGRGMQDFFAGNAGESHASGLR